MIARTLSICLLVALAAVARPARAADDPGPIVTDRPDQTESASLVPRALVQIETGYGFTRLSEGDTTSEITDVPSTLIRYGLADEVELRFFWAGYVSERRRTNGVDTDSHGVGNTALGAKIRVRDEKGKIPQLALLLDASLPTGDKALRSERIDPSFRLTAAHTLSERLGLGWNAGATWFTVDDGNDADTLAVADYTAALGIGLGERWGTFVELFGAIPLTADGDAEHLFDGGFTYLSRDNLQFDVSGGFGLNDGVVDYFLGLGFSIRLPR